MGLAAAYVLIHTKSPRLLYVTFTTAASARGIPVIMVLVNAGQIALDSLAAQPPAIVEAFYPAFGAPAVVAQVRLRLRATWVADHLVHRFAGI
jgi:hypothetical protein